MSPDSATSEMLIPWLDWFGLLLPPCCCIAVAVSSELGRVMLVLSVVGSCFVIMIVLRLIVRIFIKLLIFEFIQFAVHIEPISKSGVLDYEPPKLILGYFRFEWIHLVPSLMPRACSDHLSVCRCWPWSLLFQVSLAIWNIQ